MTAAKYKGKCSGFANFLDKLKSPLSPGTSSFYGIIIIITITIIIIISLHPSPR